MNGMFNEVRSCDEFLEVLVSWCVHESLHCFSKATTLLASVFVLGTAVRGFPRKRVALLSESEEVNDGGQGSRVVLNHHVEVLA